MINQRDIQKIEEKIGYRFKDKSLLIQAFTRTSFVNEAPRGSGGKYQSNEVLEFLGDSVLSLAIIKKLLSDKAKRYSHGLYTELNEGDFSNIKSNLSKKENLASSMDALGLAEHLIMGEGDKVLKTYDQPSVKEDLFESIIGAIYLDSDGDLGAITASLERMLDISAYIRGTAANHSAKGALQEWCQSKKRRLPMPRYETKSETGPDHKKEFVRVCYIGDRICGEGKGKNCPEADAAAATAALKLLESEEMSGAVSSSGVDMDSQTKLRNYAAKNKLPYPEFRDLGESPRSTVNEKIYVIECRFLGRSTVSEGASKSDARMRSAEQMLIQLGEKKPNEPHGAKSPKRARKSANEQRSAAGKIVKSKSKPKAKEQKVGATKTKSARPGAHRAYHKKG